MGKMKYINVARNKKNSMLISRPGKETRCQNGRKGKEGVREKMKTD